MKKLRNENPALLLIDIQEAFFNESHWGGNRNNKNAEELSGKILDKWRGLSLPIFHIRHNSTDPNSPLSESKKGYKFNDFVMPLDDETIITKRVNSAFIGTDLKERLDHQDIKTLVIVGLTTNHCVSTNTRMAGNYGYKTYVISDATASFDTIGIDGVKYNSELIHQISLANLNNEFATVINAEELFNEL